MDSHKAAKAVKPKRNMSLGLVSLLFLAPALVFYIAFELWPIIQTIWYSFYEWNGIDASTFIGVENYITVFTDPDLYGSILHSFYLIIFFSIIPIVLGLIIAVLIKDMKSKVGRSFAQVSCRALSPALQPVWPGPGCWPTRAPPISCCAQ